MEMSYHYRDTFRYVFNAYDFDNRNIGPTERAVEEWCDDIDDRLTLIKLEGMGK
jgi:hypothetical protein